MARIQTSNRVEYPAGDGETNEVTVREFSQKLSSHNISPLDLECSHSEKPPRVKILTGWERVGRKKSRRYCLNSKKRATETNMFCEYNK